MFARLVLRIEITWRRCIVRARIANERFVIYWIRNCQQRRSQGDMGIPPYPLRDILVSPRKARCSWVQISILLIGVRSCLTTAHFAVPHHVKNLQASRCVCLSFYWEADLPPRALTCVFCRHFCHPHRPRVDTCSEQRLLFAAPRRYPYAQSLLRGGADGLHSRCSG